MVQRSVTKLGAGKYSAVWSVEKCSVMQGREGLLHCIGDIGYFFALVTSLGWLHELNAVCGLKAVHSPALAFSRFARMFNGHGIRSLSIRRSAVRCQAALQTRGLADS